MKERKIAKIRIFPSVMAKTQQEIDGTLDKLRGVSREIHLDIGDGQFVPHQYGWFDVKLFPQFKYNAHLMTKNPLSWIKQNGIKVDAIIFHPEPLSEEEIKKTIHNIKSLNKKVGLALKPETKVSFIKRHLPELDFVLILTVHPGIYEAEYLKSPLKKIAPIKHLHPKIKIIVDGGMNQETIADAVKAGVDGIVSGSFVTRAENPKKAMMLLKRAVMIWLNSIPLRPNI